MTSAFLPRVQKEQRQNNRQQDNLPKRKHTLLEMSGFVVGVTVNDEGAETDADDQPDDLSFEIPHATRPHPWPLSQWERGIRDRLTCATARAAGLRFRSELRRCESRPCAGKTLRHLDRRKAPRLAHPNSSHGPRLA